jgi:3-oxoadipate enol-lactonase
MDGIADTPAGPLGFRVDGPPDAPALLFCNALGTSLELWDAQVAGLAARFRIVRYDARGHGRSVEAAPAAGLDDLGRDACAVLDAAGVGAAHVTGISLGGLTALWLGVHAPDRVRRLVLANTAARIGPPARWDERIDVVRREGLGVVAERALGTWFTAPFLSSAPDVPARFRRMITACAPDGYCGCCAALRDADLNGALGTVRAPALVVAGAHDVSTTVDDARALVTGIPGASLCVLDCAHLSNVECADAFTRHVGAFLADV